MEIGIVVLRFVFLFGSLKLLKAEWPFQISEKFKSPAMQYVINAFYVLVITHAVQYYQSYYIGQPTC